MQVYAAPFPGPGGKRQISAGGGNVPRWRRDGKEIFYVTADGQLMAAEVIARNGTPEVGKAQKLFDGIVTNLRHDLRRLGRRPEVPRGGRRRHRRASADAGAELDAVAAQVG